MKSLILNLKGLYMLKVDWNVSKDLHKTVERLCEAEGLKRRRGLGIEPLTIGMMTLSAVLLIKILHSLIKDLKHGGMLIDATKDSIEVRDMPSWDRKKVVILTKEGVNVTELKSNEDPISQLTSVLEKLDS
jgi:hypothetical protein